ncbi:unnamed protein product [Prorocentrum cordatum]|uniref:C3H1-type domain-containing protein n=1 Tax=Prorocentrum cordatum TaxID=2364126 RepID=A0ABN9U821_9DINO|nr:unnamed protein product [Polarella glacialis]
MPARISWVGAGPPPLAGPAAPPPGERGSSADRTHPSGAAKVCVCVLHFVPHCRQCHGRWPKCRRLPGPTIGAFSMPAAASNSGRQGGPRAAARGLAVGILRARWAAREPTESATMSAEEPMELASMTARELEESGRQELKNLPCGSFWYRQLSATSSSSTVSDSLSTEPGEPPESELTCDSSASSVLGEPCLEPGAWRSDAAPYAWRPQNVVERGDLYVVNTFLDPWYREAAPESEPPGARARSAPAPAARGPAAPAPWVPPPPHAAQVCPQLGPTWGSMLHQSGRCRPCQFAGRGCKSGEVCRFCHLCSAADPQEAARQGAGVLLLAQPPEGHGGEGAREKVGRPELRSVPEHARLASFLPRLRIPAGAPAGRALPRAREGALSLLPRGGRPPFPPDARMGTWNS